MIYLQIFTLYKIQYFVCTNFSPGPLFFPALRTSCETNVECFANAECKNNATTTNPRLKICLCKEGFIEKNNVCNCNY